MPTVTRKVRATAVLINVAFSTEAKNGLNIAAGQEIGRLKKKTHVYKIPGHY